MSYQEIADGLAAYDKDAAIAYLRGRLFARDEEEARSVDEIARASLAALISLNEGKQAVA